MSHRPPGLADREALERQSRRPEAPQPDWRDELFLWALPVAVALLAAAFVAWGPA